jgi:hypothetical protein
MFLLGFGSRFEHYFLPRPTQLVFMLSGVEVLVQGGLKSNTVTSTF